MNRLSKQQYKNKDLNVKDFISLKQLDMLKYRVYPKILNNFQGKQKKVWEHAFNKLLPKKSLNFDNENDYLKSNKITKNDVVINSIKYLIPDINEDNVNYLSDCFSIFTQKNKVKIIEIENKLTPIYYEIINSFSYIKRIQNVLSKYPKNNGNHHGTKHRSSSIDTLIKIQLNILENRIEGSFFPIEDEDERKKIEFQIKFMKYTLTDEYKNFPEWMNFAKIYLGFENEQLEMSEIEIKALNQLLEFFNGIRTSKEELLTSVMIYLRIQSNITTKDKEFHKELSESIMNIVRFFLQSTIIEVEKSKKKKTIIYKQEKVKNEYCIKTHLSEVPIYTYVYKKTNNPIEELMIASFNSILGIENIFEKDKPKKEEISELQILKNILKMREYLGLTKKEYKTFLFIIDRYLKQPNYLGVFLALR
ncbi:hypothetical protein ACH5BF_08640 [Arcobacter sp. YIC-464]|uniref:hypothetical protein n=1 Tax=Arcobacter sp. YIC-464 TaxID=3376631 RepID=UPI003C1DCE73